MALSENYQEGLTEGPASFSCSSTDVKRSQEKAHYHRSIYPIASAVIYHYHQNPTALTFQGVFKTKQLALKESFVISARDGGY